MAIVPACCCIDPDIAEKNEWIDEEGFTAMKGWCKKCGAWPGGLWWQTAPPDKNGWWWFYRKSWQRPMRLYASMAIVSDEGFYISGGLSWREGDICHYIPEEEPPMGWEEYGKEVE